MNFGMGRFNSDTTIVGKSISLNQESYSVVGVMPAGLDSRSFRWRSLWRPIEPARNHPASVVVSCGA
jgi:hypothetical protein